MWQKKQKLPDGSFMTSTASSGARLRMAPACVEREKREAVLP